MCSSQFTSVWEIPMTATLEPEAVAHRLSGYFATPKKPEYPQSEQERYEIFSDCVMAAILAARKLLTSEDPAVVLKAAETILKIERTRIRHNRNVSGCRPPLREIAEIPSAAKHSTTDEKAREEIESMFANLEKLFAQHEAEESEEEQVEAAPPVKPAPVFAKTEDEALAWHAEELRAGMKRAAMHNPNEGLREVSEVEADQILRLQFREWKIAAIGIPKGGYWRAVAERTVFAR
jgi:hypothetical protein